MTTNTELPPYPSNVAHVTRRIRACEGETAAQIVLEHAMRQYALAAIEAAQVVQPALKVHASAEGYLRHRYGAYRGHFAWRELEEAYSQGRYDEEMAQGPNPWPGDEPAAPQPPRDQVHPANAETCRVQIPPMEALRIKIGSVAHVQEAVRSMLIDEIIEEIASMIPLTVEEYLEKMGRASSLIEADPEADSADGIELDRLASELECHEKTICNMSSGLESVKGANE